MIDKIGTKIFVESYSPPIPVSIIAMSTPLFSKYVRAIKTIISKGDKSNFLNSF